MKKGFKIVCQNCNAEIDAISHEGNHISFVIEHWYDSYHAEIECHECGNLDKDDKQ